jgi:hypothetical protein
MWCFWTVRWWNPVQSPLPPYSIVSAMRVELDEFVPEIGDRLATLTTFHPLVLCSYRCAAARAIPLANCERSPRWPLLMSSFCCRTIDFDEAHL